ncbi:MAG TPA: thioesterase family protein [Candidatus Polarisedimenticolia bacterium]|nr:thioesterase family protein [Candidatus Polarisedimenticolia bacterium]
MSYTAAVKVRFGDIDRAGIAYYPNLFHYFHIAFEEFFEEFVGIPYPRLLDEQRLGFPTVRVETDFLSPVKYGDTLRIGITIPRMGRSSAEFLFSAARGSETSPCIRSRQTVVAVDLGTLRPVPIPESLRRIFARCAGG